jgi:hypothetical protein
VTADPKRDATKETEDAMNEATLPLQTATQTLLQLVADAMARMNRKQKLPKRGRLHRV